MKTTFRRSFVRDLKKVKDQTVRHRVRKMIEAVEAATDLQGIGDFKKLAGTQNCYRIRIGEYRLGVVIDEDAVDFVRCLLRRYLYRYFP